MEKEQKTWHMNKGYIQHSSWPKHKNHFLDLLNIIFLTFISHSSRVTLRDTILLIAISLRY